MGVSDFLNSSTSAEVNTQVSALFANAKPLAKELAPVEKLSFAKKVTKPSTVTKEKVKIIRKGNTINPKYAADSEEKLARTLFVGNVPASTKKNSLRSLAAKFGGLVESLRFRSGPVNPKDFRSQGKSTTASLPQATMNAYVVFKTSDAVSKALRSDFQGFTLDGHLLRLDRVKCKTSIPSTAPIATPTETGGVFDRKRSVYIWGLPADVTDLDIIGSFSAISDLSGKVKGVRIVKDFAYVLFVDRGCVKTVVDRASEVLLRGKPVKFERVAKPEELKQRQDEKRKSVEAREIKKAKSKERLTKRFGTLDNKNMPEFLKKNSQRKPRHKGKRPKQ